jgi:VanZ family protein
MIPKLSPLKRITNKILSVLAFLAYSGLVFYFSVRPIGEGAPVIGLPGADKLFHAGEFALFVLIAYVAIHHFADTGQTRNSVVTLSIFYASLTEFSQAFIVYRTSSWLDWLANLVGISIGVVMVILIINKNNKKREQG